MAKDKDKDLTPEEEEGKAKQGFKLELKLAIPILLAQLVIAYFLAGFVIAPMVVSTAKAGVVKEVEEDDVEDDGEFGVVYQVEDVIVNPAESGGSHYVVMNIAFEVDGEDDVAHLEKMNAKLRDVLIRTVSSKTIDELDGPDDKEMLRQEIFEKVSEMLPKRHLNNVYFVSFILQ